jgi:class 3 adenylate cyclase
VPYYLSGLCYIELKKYDSAIYFLDRALSIAIKNKLIDRINECRHGLAKVYIKQGKLDEAKRLVNETVSYYLEERTDAALAVSYQLLGTVYFFKARYDSALVYALLAKELGKSAKGAINLIEINQLLSDIYKNKGDYLNAYKYLNEMQDHKDSIYQSDISTQIELSEAQYDFDKEKFVMEKEKKKAMQLAQGFGILLLVIGGALYFVRKERKKSEDLLLNILPLETAKELKKFGKAITKRHEEVTVMFFDVKEFSALAEHIPSDSLILILDYYFSAFDDIISKYSDIEKIKTIGDCYMCVSGLHNRDTLHALNAVNAACDLMDFVASTQEEVLRKFQYSFHFRGGLHSGAIVSGVVGSHKYAYDVWGDTVNIASRMESSGEIGKINISNATYELVKDHFNCSYRGKIEVKNQLALEMYFVTRS